MCTFVETPDLKVLIDAGVALGPRFRKLPHPQEYRARNECRERIRRYADKADVMVVSHYHNDHHTPNYTETVWIGCSAEESEQIYRNKHVLAKDVRNSINFSQRRRGWMFQRFIKRIGGKCEAADGKSFDFGSTKVTISQPVPHGEGDSEMGWVVMTSVRSREEVFVHTSDVQGPMSAMTTQLILDEKPDLLVLGGPPAYLSGVRVANASISSGILNASKIAGLVPTVIFEHHILRSPNWRSDVSPVYAAGASMANRVVTAADYLGEPVKALEASREDLYKMDPPSAEFMKWTGLKQEKRRVTSPPV
jgi:predicted metallo-beta-lactamase superfamily hydrolase